jgi:chromate transport protein ChrA
LVASFGLIFPATIIVPLVVWIGRKTGSRPVVKAAVRGIRAAALGLIAAAALFFFENSVISGLPGEPLWRGPAGPVTISWAALGVYLLALLAVGRFKVRPIPLIVFSALAGVLLGLSGFL